MATWDFDLGGGFTLVGSGRTSAIPSDLLPAEKEITLQLSAPSLNHGVFVLIQCSGAGRSGYEVGLVGANVVIRSVQWADPALVVVRDSAAHGLNTAIPFTLRVRNVAGII